MSYCRCGNDSDVYLYASGDGSGGYIYCFHIGFNAPEKHKGANFYVKTAEEALKKLIDLKADGLKVPKSAITRLKNEMSNEP